MSKTEFVGWIKKQETKKVNYRSSVEVKIISVIKSWKELNIIFLSFLLHGRHKERSVGEFSDICERHTRITHVKCIWAIGPPQPIGKQSTIKKVVWYFLAQIISEETYLGLTYALCAPNKPSIPNVYRYNYISLFQIFIVLSIPFLELVCAAFLLVLTCSFRTFRFSFFTKSHLFLTFLLGWLS